MYVFHLLDDGPSDEDLGDCDNCSVAQMWSLPNSAFCGIWEHLVFDEEIKGRVSSSSHSCLEKNVLYEFGPHMPFVCFVTL